MSSRSADRRAHRRHRRDALVDPLARDPDLDRPEALLDQRVRVLGPLTGIAQRTP